MPDLKKPLKIKEQKLVIVGLNGSGKTEFGKFIVKKSFKRCVWVLINPDDMKGMPSNVTAVISTDRENRIKEIDGIIGDVIKLAKEGKVDGLVLDEADLFLNDNAEIKKFANINDMVILQRHHGLGVIIMSRRPANLPTMLYETSDTVILFASPRSDNVDRKLKPLHRDLAPMVSTLRKGDYKFVTITTGENPILHNPIPLKTKK